MTLQNETKARTSGRFVGLGAALALALLLPAAAIAAGVSENFDGVSAPALPSGWSATVATGALSDVPWATRDAGYYHGTSAPNAVWIDEFNDYADISLVSPTWYLPATGTATVTFHHSYTLWAPDDSDLANGVFNGGVFEISFNGAPFQDVLAAGGAFVTHGYNATLDPSFANPIAPPPTLNRAVWGSDSGGFVTTKVTLPASAAGKSVQFRWRLGTAQGGSSHDGRSGWWIDDFECDQCSTQLNDIIFEDGFDGS
jgi:hypothetical protein